MREQLKVGLYTKNAIRGHVLSTDRDKDCPICYEAFNLEKNKPLMVCWQQHMVCKECFDHGWKGNECPLCRAKFARSQVMASR